MKNNKFLKIGTIFIALICLLCLCSCGDETNDEPRKTKRPETTSVPSDNTPVVSEETSEVATEMPNETATPGTNQDSDFIKITGAADNVGIYAIVVKLKSGAPEKGKIELVYHGEKGSPQENSIVNTFLIEYWKESDGLFEIRTFFDGEVYQNYHDKDEVKVTNEFGATLRAGDVTVSFTPDGGDKVEIFRETADYFR